MVWVHLGVVLVRDPAGAPDYFNATLEDITELAQLEQRLVAYAEELERVFEAMTDAVMVFDAQAHILRSAPESAVIWEAPHSSACLRLPLRRSCGHSP